MSVELKKIMDHIKKEFDEMISEEVLIKGSRLSTKRSFKKGEIILGIGESMTKTYFILSGIARSYYLDIEGHDVTKSFMKEYDFCVGESIIANTKSGESFEALEDMIALEFCASRFKSYLLSDQSLTQLYIKNLEKTIIYKMNRENGFQIKSATERYLDFKRSYSTIENRVNQSYIASYLGITPVSLSRIRRTIREEY